MKKYIYITFLVLAVGVAFPATAIVTSSNYMAVPETSDVEVLHQRVLGLQALLAELQQAHARRQAQIAAEVARVAELSQRVRFGQRNDQVLELQKLLNASGANLPETGYFGNMTKGALSNYQAGLQASLNVGSDGLSLQLATGLGGTQITGSLGFDGGLFGGALAGTTNSEQWMQGKGNGKASPTVACVRNKNWGNIKKGGTSDWDGTVGYDKSGHAIFDREDSGVRAYMLNLKNQYRNGKFKSIRQLISYYTHIESHQAIYTKYITMRTGFNADADIKLINGGVVDKRVLYPMARAMFEFECGGDPGVNDVYLGAGYVRAFGADGKNI